MDKEKMGLKGLFINHDFGYYGAATSLKLLLRNYKEIVGDMMMNKWPVEDADIIGVKRMFGDRVINVFGYRFSYDLCYLGAAKNQLKLRSVLKRTLSNEIEKRKAYSLIQKNRYDFIHLNSLIAHSLIHKKYPFIIHIREIYDNTNKQVFRSLENAAGIIFIDEATRKPFRNVPLKNYIVLNNPVDMTCLRGYSPVGPKESIDYRQKTVFSFIGYHTENKGTHFIISCFKKLINDNALLLIVGDGAPESYLQNCKRLASDDKRIIFHDTESDIRKIYFVSDYVLRGEPYTCVGRTVYEGLYAGCDVIIPGTHKDKGNFFEYEKFKEKIHFYRPRNNKELEDLLTRLSYKKVYNKSYFSNVDSYISQFHNFIMDTINKKR